MRLASAAGRLTTFVDGAAVDVEKSSGGRLSADPQAAYEDWEDLVAWGESVGAVGGPADFRGLDAPVPTPRQVFAVGLNYRDHVAEMGLEGPPAPAIFTKFPTCITGPDATVTLASDTTDWEIELVVVIARRAHRVARSDAHRYIAGYTIGQDISERTMLTTGSMPQFSLGKSFPGYGPIGPWVVTLDEFEDPDDLALRCSVNGTARQDARTSQMIRPVSELVESLSAVCPLLPGDMIFTGTPSGVGMALDPPCYLAPGDRIDSMIEGIGTLVTTVVGSHDDPS